MSEQYEQSKPDEIVDQFGQFYRRYYSDAIGDLAQNYPNEQRALYVDWNDLYQYDDGLADDLLSQGETIREYAEEALRLYDLPIDVSLGRAAFRPIDIPEKNQFSVGDYRTKHLGNLLAIKGEVVSCSEVKPFAEEAAFECPKCATLTYVPQSGFDMQDPHECMGCERQPNFKLNMSQSELVDYRQFTLEAVDSNLEEPPTLQASVKQDLVDAVGPGDYLTVVGILNAKSDADSTVLDHYVSVWNIEKDGGGKVDALSASDIREKITEYVKVHEGDGDFGTARTDVKDDLTDEYGARKQEIETQIETLVEDESAPIAEMAGGEKLLHQ